MATEIVGKVVVVLPWPARDLWPNRKVHWAVKNTAAQSAKREGFFLAKETLDLHEFAKCQRATIRYTARPPTEGRYDIHDNLPGACKPYVDGIAYALGIDDSVFVSSQVERGEPQRFGAVIVVIEAVDGDASV